MNRAKYDFLSPARKKIIDGHCTTEWAVKISRPWTDFEAAGCGKKKALAGHETYSLTPEQVKAWKTATQPLHEQWAGVAKAGAGF